MPTTLEKQSFSKLLCTRSAPSVAWMLPGKFYSSLQLCGQGAGLAVPFPIPALPSSRARIQWGHHCLCGAKRIKANGSNCRNEEPQPSMGIGVWASLGSRAEVPWREARDKPGSTRDTGWIRPFQLDKSSTVRRSSCRGGQDRTGGCRGAH